MPNRKTHFAVVYLCTILLTFVFLGGTAFVIYKQFVEKPAESSSAVSSEDDILFQPDKEQNQTLLFILEGGEKDRDDVFVVTRFLPVEEKVYFIPIPGQTFSQLNTTKSTVYEFYRTGGAARAVEAVESALNIQVEKYVRFDKTAFNTLVDIFGGVNYTVPYDMIYDNKETGESVVLREGRQLLDGTKLRWLITFPAFKEGEDFRIKLMGSVFSDMVNQALTERLANTLDSSFNSIINGVETNITAYDYQFRKDAILYLIQPGTSPVQFLIPAWEENDAKQFALTSAFKDEVLERFQVEPIIPM